MKSGYIQAIKRPYHNMIDEIIKKMKSVDAKPGYGRHTDDFILGFELALRILANANGSFRNRLETLIY